MDKLKLELLKTISELESTPKGAYNIRENGKSVGRASTENIEIVTKSDTSGIDIYIKPNCVNESVHIPVILTEGGLKDSVVNDFHIGENSDVLIVAGCGIHNDTDEISSHSGKHCFYVGKNSKVRYVERHYGEGKGLGGKAMYPVTEIYLEENASMIMETSQIKGISDTKRSTTATLQANARLEIREKIYTHKRQNADTSFKIYLNGKGSAGTVISRSVAENSTQKFESKIVGNNDCFGHVECDAILLEDAKVTSIPEIVANVPDAKLSHEAVVGKIAGEQIIKLMSLGLSEKEAEDTIINGFLK